MATRTFTTVMKIYTGIYIVVGIFFFVFHAELAQLLMMQPAPNRFWVTLTVSMMAMLAYVAWQSSQRPRERAFVHVHLLSKTVSVAGFLLSFVLDPAVWAYLVGAVTDFSIILVVLFFYRRMNAAQ
jgi:hypothetical protein